MHLIIIKSLFASATLIQQSATTLNYVFCTLVIPHYKTAVSEKKKKIASRPVQPLQTLKIKNFSFFLICFLICLPKENLL